MTKLDLEKVIAETRKQTLREAATIIRRHSFNPSSEWPDGCGQVIADVREELARAVTSACSTNPPAPNLEVRQYLLHESEVLARR